MAEFDFGTAFREAFGYDAPRDLSQLQIAEKPARREQSAKGAPFYATDLSGREFFLPVYLDGLLLPFAIISMTWRKTVVETTMPERGGSVNELININDYVFNIKGLLVNENDEYPDDEIQQLHDKFLINKSLSMRSALTDIVLSGRPDGAGDDDEGHKVVVLSVNWPPVSGVEHVKPFEIELKSDLIFELEIE